MVLGLALPVLLAQRRHPASHAGVRGSENSPKGIQAALIAYLLLPGDVIQLQGSTVSLPAAYDSSAIPHTKMEWGHYTSGSVTLPEDSHKRTHAYLHLHKHACTYLHVVTTSRSAYVFLCTNGSSHTYTYATTHTHQTRLCCHYKKLYSSSAGWLTFSQRVRVDCKLQLEADQV